MTRLGTHPELHLVPFTSIAGNMKSAFLSIAAIGLCSNLLFAQNSQVSWSTFDTGSQVSASATTHLNSTVGQVLVGSSQGGSTRVENGFLSDPSLRGFSVGVSISPGWNMISNPLTTANDSVRQLYPTASFPYAFAFVPATGYVEQYRMTKSVGYWEKFPASTTESIGGTARSLDSIPVSAGWNMIGSISYSVDTSTITTVPLGIRASQYFGYNGGYSATQTIVPGRAYWAKSNAVGKFILSTTFLAKSVVPGSKGLDGFNTVTIADAQGGSQTLYFGEDVQGSFPVDMFELPPPGPEGVFDTRFESQRMVEIYDTKEGSEAAYPIVLRSAAYPVSVSWNIVGADVRRTFGVQDGVNGTLVPRKEIAGAGYLTITNPAVNRLIVSTGTATVPSEFSLEQNYPNPFNPSTKISFTVPMRGFVELKVFDMLGREVATLVHQEMNSGAHETTWDAAGWASSVYFYRLKAGTFTETKRMLLLR